MRHKLKGDVEASLTNIMNNIKLPKMGSLAGIKINNKHDDLI